MQRKVGLALLVTISFFAMTFYFMSNAQVASGAGTLSNIIVEPSNNLFSLESHYVVGFTTGTTGTIKTFTITFPAGFNIANTHLILSSGIKPGGISVAGKVVTYTVTTAVSVPAGTNVMIDLGKIVNNMVGSNTVSIATMDALNNVIDGPTVSPAFTLKAVSTVMLGTNSVTTAKIAAQAVTTTKIAIGTVTGENIALGTITGSNIASGTITGDNIASGTITGDRVNSGFMEQLILNNDVSGNLAGWSPSGSKTVFSIFDSELTPSSNVIASVVEPTASLETCGINDISSHSMFIVCTSPPSTSASLHYTVINMPTTILVASKATQGTLPDIIKEKLANSK